MPTTPFRTRAGALLRRVAGAGRATEAGGIGLAVATVVALVWANWPGSLSYQTVWEATAPWSSPLGLTLSLREWINDGAMVGFFTLVGLEIRREMTAGELRSWHRCATPLVAAAVGMAVPALLYTAILHGGPGAGGWGIPMATDVAFAIGALAVLARGVSPRVRVFLLTLAVADDIGSVIILVVVYSRRIDGVALGAGLAFLGAMVLVRSRAAPAAWVFWLLGAACWWAFVHAGVEPAVVGFAIGLCLPTTSKRARGGTGRAWGRGPRHWEHRLEPWVNLAVLPAYALANTGLRVAGSGLGSGAALRILVAVVVARVVGKTVGIGAAAVAVSRVAGPRYRPRIAPRPLLGVGALASIGFTVPLLIIRSALPDGPLVAGATAGLLVTTVIGFALGAVLFAIPRGGSYARR